VRDILPMYRGTPIVVIPMELHGHIRVEYGPSGFPVLLRMGPETYEALLEAVKDQLRGLR